MKRFVIACILAGISFLAQGVSAHAQSYFYGYYYPDEQRFHTNKMSDGGYDYYGAPTWNSPKPLPAPLYQPQASNQAGSIRVILPNSQAVVWFGDFKTKSTGTERVYQTPVMKPGTYDYQVKVAYPEGGQELSQQRTITVTPGQLVVVDFTKPSAATTSIGVSGR